MCSTCNPKTYTPVSIQVSADRTEDKLQNPLGLGDLVIRCDLNGKNYFIAVKSQPNSAYRIYRCPTCGNKLY